MIPRRKPQKAPSPAVLGRRGFARAGILFVRGTRGSDREHPAG